MTTALAVAAAAPATPGTAAPGTAAPVVPTTPSVFLRRPRLVSAGGSTPLAARTPLIAALPEPEERGFAISREQYAALPLPRGERTVVSSSSGAGGRRKMRVSGWVKGKVLGMGMGKKK